jgi:AcrR family transcriptional regulator
LIHRPETLRMASDAARTGRQEAVSEHKRALIIDAARRLFEAEGLEGASVRAIAREAGYTAGAIYFHFESKEAIYAAVLEESVDRLNAAVDAAVVAAGDHAAERLRAAGLAFFDFYAHHPRDLDLGFYLFRGGIRPRGLSPDLDARLNGKLQASLAPIGHAAAALGASPLTARALTADAFAHATGLLILEHSGRLRLFDCAGRSLMRAYLDRTLARLAPGADGAA